MSTRRQIQEWVSKRFAVLVAVVVASFAVVLWQALIVHEHAQIKLAVEQEALTLRANIQARIEPEILALVRMAKRWEAHGGTPREEWEADAIHYLADQTGQWRISWIDPSYIARWTVPTQPTTYRGVNLAREERRRVAMEAARETREAKVTLANNMFGDNRGLLVFVPLFVGERFDGFIQGIFRTPELLDPLLSEHASLGFSTSVSDDEKEIASHRTSDRQEYLQWLQETEVEIRNIHWRIQVWPKPELIANVRSSLPEVALAAGLLLAFLLSVAIRQTQSSRLRTQEV
ncbi:MAG: CHASE domain-containing protein, partial [Acidobacteria bacterium]|nr:CHASE domain-containing protein [Acidobacteriota bacterium]